MINDCGRNALVQYPSGFDFAQAREIVAPFWPHQARTSADTDGLLADLLPADNGIRDPIE